ncbi:cytochrome c oxidase subunit 8A, mitochondrial [Sphaeramia orbicularis]|uniref:Cytochrome c oxidase subunit 8A, mitochondrial-like n=1 Tax=Sphaeramia orbicularis TaxID=375764 RepID=A0A673B020_9TELE|nr:cytochrome c oxidase subunit 8A, mitochondrial-like [Sphaeramia orbicularis]
MSGFLRTITSRAAHVLRGHTQRANLSSKPAKEVIGAVETGVGLGLFSLAILGPSGWILAHLEDYKKKD